MSGTCGPTSSEPLAHCVPEESSSKTWQVMSLWGWTEFSGILPRSGMTRRGVLYELPTPEHRTAAPASSSLLPTPVVNDMGAGKTVDAWDAWDAWTARMRSEHGNGNGHGASLSIEVSRLLPTPTASEGTGPGYTDRVNGGGRNLRTEVSLLPTPRASDGEKGGPNQRGSSGDLMLPSAVMTLLPTPTTQTGGAATRSGDRSDEMLLPAVAKAASSGALTNPLSGGGSPSSDGQLPGQLSLDATGSG